MVLFNRLHLIEFILLCSTNEGSGKVKITYLVAVLIQCNDPYLGLVWDGDFGGF